MFGKLVLSDTASFFKQFWAHGTRIIVQIANREVSVSAEDFHGRRKVFSILFGFLPVEQACTKKVYEAVTPVYVYAFAPNVPSPYRLW